METAYQRYKSYYQQYARQYYHAHRAYWRRYRKLHREEILAKRRRRYRSTKRVERLRQKKYLDTVYAEWFGLRRSRKTNPRIMWRAEELAAKRILHAEGFSNILWIPGLDSGLKNASRLFFFDILAEKDRHKCAILVTTSPHKQFLRRDAIGRILDFFRMRFYVCAIKPDLSGYLLNEYPVNKIPHTMILTPSRILRLKAIP